MKRRCYFPGDPAYKDYGGRGIGVCEEWLMSFDVFADDVEREAGTHPGKGFSIDRIDNNGNYEPGNVRWATWKVQARNRRNTVYVTYRGKRWKLADLCDELELPLSAISSRLNLGWPISDAVKQPAAFGKPHRLMDTKFGPPYAPGHHYPEHAPYKVIESYRGDPRYSTVIRPEEIPGRPEFDGRTQPDPIWRGAGPAFKRQGNGHA